jgi:hypothetical protein
LPDETPAERLTRLRAKALEHLEAARACIDETGDGTSNFLIERATDPIGKPAGDTTTNSLVPFGVNPPRSRTPLLP